MPLGCVAPGSILIFFAEATAIQRALMILRDNGFTDIILLPDCLSMIQCIHSSQRDRSFLGPVVGDIKNLQHVSPLAYSKHFSRKSDVAAHILARRSEISV